MIKVDRKRIDIEEDKLKLDERRLRLEKDRLDIEKRLSRVREDVLKEVYLKINKVERRVEAHKCKTIAQLETEAEIVKAKIYATGDV